MKEEAFLLVFCGLLLASVQASAVDAELMKMFKQTLGAPCPSGWTRFKSYCYLVSSSTKTWHQAQAYCRALRGELVKINSVEENEFVLALARKEASSKSHVWIGLKWNSGKNAFLWCDHSVPVYTNWAPGEPNGKAAEPCNHLYTGIAGLTGYWNDISCGTRNDRGFVCKRLP